MKLAAVYNTWNDLWLLKLSINNIRPLVDVVIVVFSRQSNTGEKHLGPDGSAEGYFPTGDQPIYFIQREPNLNLNQRDNETHKRNEGLNFARILNCTHFVMMDSDEFYTHEEFLSAKNRFHVEPNLKGLVCPLKCYFKSPTLMVQDHTLVPFIHELTPTIKHEFNRNYPFAWINNQIRIDPTRSLNINSGVEYADEVTMSHLSWVRTDYKMKIRNSTARHNIERSTILQDLKNAKPGYYCEFYKQTLVEVKNIFNIPESLGIDKSIE